MIKTKLFACLLALCPVMGHGAILYRVEQVNMPTNASENEFNDDQAFARVHRFYLGGMYNLSLWADDSDNGIHVSGKNTSSYEAVAGLRLYDIFRLELNYIHTDAKWDAFSMTGDGAMINALVDARIDSLYRLFRRQRVIPYVGVGAGVSWNSGKHIHIEDSVSPMAAAMVGLGIELGEHFTIDVGYRYMYMFAPKFEVLDNLAPNAHQLRAGVRVNF